MIISNNLWVKNIRDAIGATIKTKRGMDDSLTALRLGRVIDIDGDQLVCEFTDGSIHRYHNGGIDIDVTIEAGKRYMLMDGKIVTIHKCRPLTDRYFFMYSEYCDDTRNSATEIIYSNGLAYHYDCHCSVLKVVE